MQYLCVSIPPAVRPTLLRQMDRGSLTCAQIWVRAITHEAGSMYKQVCTRVNSEGQKKMSLTLPSQGIEARVFEFISFDAGTIELRPPSVNSFKKKQYAMWTEVSLENANRGDFGVKESVAETK